MDTGGLYLDKTLSGILRPCFSYLTAIKNNEITEVSGQKVKLQTSKNTPNFFTYGFSHDWAMCQGFLRIIGEDHFSALKNPRMNLRYRSLEIWGKQNTLFS